MSRAVLPQRPTRIPDETAGQIVRLSIRQVPENAIAERVGVHRKTVRRVVERTQAALAITTDTEKARAESVALYSEVIRTAFEGVETAQERGRSTAMYLTAITSARQRIDGLLGLAPADSDDPALTLAKFKAIVVGVIQGEAPEVAPKIVQRLLEARNGDG